MLFLHPRTLCTFPTRWWGREERGGRVTVPAYYYQVPVVSVLPEFRRTMLWHTRIDEEELYFTPRRTYTMLHMRCPCFGRSRDILKDQGDFLVRGLDDMVRVIPRLPSYLFPVIGNEPAPAKIQESVLRRQVPVPVIRKNQRTVRRSGKAPPLSDSSEPQRYVL